MKISARENSNDILFDLPTQVNQPKRTSSRSELLTKIAFWILTVTFFVWSIGVFVGGILLLTRYQMDWMIAVSKIPSLRWFNEYFLLVSIFLLLIVYTLGVILLAIPLGKLRRRLNRIEKAKKAILIPTV